MTLWSRFTGFFWASALPDKAEDLICDSSHREHNRKATETNCKRDRDSSSDLSDTPCRPGKKLKIMPNPESKHLVKSPLQTHHQGKQDRLSPEAVVPSAGARDTSEAMDEMEYAKRVLEGTPEFDLVTTREARRRRADELRNAGWKQSVIEFAIMLDMLGREPFLPSAWILDHPTIPIGLFTETDPFVNSVSDKGFRASNALKELIALGPQVRDARHTEHRAYHTITKKAILKYMKWAYKDASLAMATGLSRKSLELSTGKGLIPPILVLEAAVDKSDVDEIERSLLTKLDNLRCTWDDIVNGGDTEYDSSPALETPVLYGVVCTFTIVAILWYDVTTINAAGQALRPRLRNVSTFNFSRPENDVWNALRLAIFGNHVRNELTETEDSLKLRAEDYEDSSDHPDDPDM